MDLPCSFTVLIMLWYTAVTSAPRRCRSAGSSSFRRKGTNSTQISFLSIFLLKEKTERIPMWEPREHHPPELPLFCCGYPCTIYKKRCKGRYSVNRMTEETRHEGWPLFGTENKIFQNLRYYTYLLDVDFQQRYR